MSRHRFVRNIDVDDVMAEDDDGYVMSSEEKAQLATSLVLARQLLSDVRPPIPDTAIVDSLWHYWFDVDKAVTWLRRDHEKKGAPIPPDLLPTPTPGKRTRGPPPLARATSAPRTFASPATHAKPSPAPQPAASPQPPLSALQRLSLARKEASRAAWPVHASTSAPSPAASPVPTQSPALGADGKPLSKLALIAQKRREAAAAASAASNGTSTPSQAWAEPSARQIAALQPSAPVSKLAQRLAAARAKTQTSAPVTEPIPPQPEATTLQPKQAADDAIDVDAEPSYAVGLFAATAPPAPRAASASPFFALLTSHSSAPPPDPALLSGMHIPSLPSLPDVKQTEQRVRAAFDGAESPDDVVLKARGGRAGTSAAAGVKA
ncbi:hypothetical protein Q5752_001823 [Cryptotrichosporon argae]